MLTVAEQPLLRVGSSETARIVRQACELELQAFKPGNVGVHGDGHGMCVADFLASAQAAARWLARPGYSVGERILAAVEATRQRVGCNTNLGIVLLCAPLAQAALMPSTDGDLRSRLRRVLGALTVRDADLAFRAIRLAAPGGLGESGQHDVRRPAETTLLNAMIEAQTRDRIAYQYASAYEDIFDFAVPRLCEGLARWDAETWAVSGVFLGLLARFADSHIARKHGTSAAEAVSTRARALEQRLLSSGAPTQCLADFAQWDKELKEAGLNPGTSADLTVAALVALRLQATLLSGSRPGLRPSCEGMESLRRYRISA